MGEEEHYVESWRIILSAILDFITAFIGFGVLVAAMTGGLTNSGFQVSGLPALLVFALIILYFWLFPKYFGGRIWQRILKAVRKRP